jgi:hypothetical protein
MPGGRLFGRGEGPKNSGNLFRTRDGQTLFAKFGGERRGVASGRQIPAILDLGSASNLVLTGVVPMFAR